MGKTAPGKGLLIASGILLILWNVFLAIVALIALIGAGALFSAGAVLAGLVLLIAVLYPAASFVSGIVALVKSGNPVKANTCLVWGIIVIALVIINVVLSVISDSAAITTTFIVYNAVNLVLAILLMIGAKLNKKAA